MFSRNLSSQTSAHKSSASHRCLGMGEQERGAMRFCRCRRTDTNLVQVGQIFFWLCPVHASALLGAIEQARNCEVQRCGP